MQLRPTPPHPITATVLPGSTFAVFKTDPMALLGVSLF